MRPDQLYPLRHDFQEIRKPRSREKVETAEEHVHVDCGGGDLVEVEGVLGERLGGEVGGGEGDGAVVLGDEVEGGGGGLRGVAVLGAVEDGGMTESGVHWVSLDAWSAWACGAREVRYVVGVSVDGLGEVGVDRPVGARHLGWWRKVLSFVAGAVD